MVLLLTVVLATAMVVGDGILTPSISMLGAVAGLQVATDSFISEGEGGRFDACSS
jgi:K+ transporter